jgi:small subunit ribosomal protein S6
VCGVEPNKKYANVREVMSLETVAKKKMYEGMFLVDSARAGADWDGIIAAIKKILERAEAEIVSIRKWDDRRLAYEIKHVARGTYILVYFRADGEYIQGIEKAVQLSEKILRVLILSAEHMTVEDIEKETPATKVEKEERTPSRASEPVEEVKTESPDDLHEAPAVEEESEKAGEDKTVEEPGAKEDAGAATASEPTGEAEQVDEAEEESQPKPVADD